ncbi:uncharacterized protein LOC117554649 isoform X7 [Gymnodraco acuticeps]|uniref:Uncharacterized protein LOC117554649 isoform X7 n=1 Tax=Gymnodraco acuticeps TaxID=8218 RepID=A0A6P8VFT8_GYMAC|nr:uncharacterized protein LOC117554649 isoform X7 [Gymnodraco acuticeps]
MPQFNNWLYLTQHGMFCRMCRQHKPPVKKGPLKRAFIEVGILVFRKDYIERHISSEPHQYSVKHQVSLASGYSVMQAFEPTVIMEHEAVIGGFKCLYWLVKNEMAHHTNYPKLLSLAQLLGCDYFEKLKVDQRNNYQSHRIVDEMLEILAQIVELPILQEIRSSQAISLEVDETTDVSISRQLDLHVRHLDKEGCVFNHFLDLVTLEDGKADSVVAAIKSVLQKKELPVDRLYGLGTDGAAVMTGASHTCYSGEHSEQARPHSPERSLLAYTKTWKTQVDLGPLALPERRRGSGGDTEFWSAPEKRCPQTLHLQPGEQH